MKWLFIAAIAIAIGIARWYFNRRANTMFEGRAKSPETPGYVAYAIVGEIVGPTVGFPVPDGIASRRPLPGSKVRPQAPSNRARLRTYDLPVLESTDDVCRWLGVSIRALLAMANPSNMNRPHRTNYFEWTRPKKSGGVRIICSPKPRLRALQQRIRTEILDRIPQHPDAHGFVRGRDSVSNASAHVGREIVANFDLRHFFEQVTFPRVIGIFRRMGYSKEVSRWFAMICTHRPNLCEFLDSNHPKHGLWRVRRHAVQGAPTSPALANLAVRRMDLRLAGLAARFNATYTRYADDLTFSGDENFKRGLARFIPLLRTITGAERFRLNRRKQRIMRPSRRQEVTGVVVNEKINVAREDYDRLKAIIHNAGKLGSLQSQNRENRSNFRSYLLGKAAHVRHLNAEHGERLIRAIHAVAD